MRQDAEQPFFHMSGVSKSYGGAVALDHAELTVRRGRIHAILGENGAGKSTLLKVMSGVVQPDEGTMHFDGREVSFASPAEANAAGIVCVYQELSLIPDLSVADNICAANPPRRFGMIDGRAQRRQAEQALARAGAVDINPLAKVRDLPLSRQQMVELAKGLAHAPRILILDEATSALTAADVARVIDVLKGLREEGLALLFISHRMHEVKALADECTVYRNGRHVMSFEAGARSDNEVVEMMIGRKYQHAFPAKPASKPGDARSTAPVLACRDLAWSDTLRGISFSLQPGEILGLGGLDGQGQRELLLALFGVLRGCAGKIEINGKAVSIGSPTAARANEIGMALIPEDRKTEGLMLPMSVRENLSFAALDRMSTAGIIDRGRQQSLVERMMELLAIKSFSIDAPVGSLSGGNQQKVVIAKWLMRQPGILLLCDPTRGIDVGTKQELYQLLRRIANEGAAIVFYSTDYDELIGCCDRVLVLYEGRIKKELVGSAITEQNLIASALDLPVGQSLPSTGVAR
ncbi:Ribose ABC transport system, ATP-binding protein RbsA (plasmid) [Paraburkholderia caribensis MBA4]|uniref:Ribose ABC transport system, ATP-binding protein RbsA n=1 Tax=Paraburkholderia caribensis MBA4 TaxID=1323664 RepID=A0A0P0RNJ6_9BURK|nr:sugar ABC transporter ATP-binding protein [Paraburkholderia caribensis]ALL70570.1 Ribose ABC transport system, ATP-binding protein RbsA [Paraburkholderia caribensis MBA4]